MSNLDPTRPPNGPNTRPDMMMPPSTDENARESTPKARANRRAIWAVVALAVIVVGGYVAVRDHGAAQNQGAAAGAAQANGDAVHENVSGPWAAQNQPSAGNTSGASAANAGQ